MGGAEYEAGEGGRFGDGLVKGIDPARPARDGALGAVGRRAVRAANGRAFLYRGGGGRRHHGRRNGGGASF